MPTAIITGATGILGRGIVNSLAKDPSTWTSVHALSRSQKEEYPSNVKHNTIDLLGEAQDIAKRLEGIEADYVFYTAYKECENEQIQAETNSAMLRNFLQALTITGAEKQLKRVVLICGSKHYGSLLGALKLPAEESDPILDGPNYPPNFYYNQYDVLRECSAGKSWDWVVTLPHIVIGLAKGNFMSISLPLALYAVVNRELGRPIAFPGSPIQYTLVETLTSSNLHGDFCRWVALTPEASNQWFNVVNGDVESWQNMWPKVAARFGVSIPKDQFAGPAPLPLQVPLFPRSPLASYTEKAGLEGLPAAETQCVLDVRVNLLAWSQDPEVKAAWEKLAAREGLEVSAWEKATWMFANACLGRPFNIVQNMTKARKLGWTGFMDTWESFSETFDELERERLLPKST